MTRDFKTADCCMNCIHRETGQYVIRPSHNKITCLLDGEPRSIRIICSMYSRTENPYIIGGENKILNDNAKRVGNIYNKGEIVNG